MEIDELLMLTDDELYAEIGKSLPATRSLGDLALKGKAWFSNNKKAIMELICPRYGNFKNNQKDSVTEIAAILGDFFTGVPTLTIAVIVIKIGLKSLCKETN